MTGNYYLEYIYIPSLIERIKAKEAPIEILDDIEKWKEELEQQGFDINWDEFFVEKIRHIIKYENSPRGRVRISGKYYYVYTFPSIKEPPEAKYGIVRHLISKDKYDYYTFESDMNGGWCIGRQTKGVHKKMVQTSDMTKEEFVSFVKNESTSSNWSCALLCLIAVLVISLFVWLMTSDLMKTPIIGNITGRHILFAILFAPALFKGIKDSIDDYVPDIDE